MFLPAESGLRLGVTVSKKVGPSVTRSLVKRRLREAFRQNRHAWPIDGVVVVVARAPAAAASYQELEADFFAWARFMNRSAR
jgi:ribonuclease P protein component